MFAMNPRWRERPIKFMAGRAKKSLNPTGQSKIMHARKVNPDQVGVRKGGFFRTICTEEVSFPVASFRNAFSKSLLQPTPIKLWVKRDAWPAIFFMRKTCSMARGIANILFATRGFRRA